MIYLACKLLEGKNYFVHTHHQIFLLTRQYTTTIYIKVAWDVYLVGREN